MVAVAFDSLEAGENRMYRTMMDSANALRPHHPTLRLHQARAALLTGDTTDAVLTLQLVADMGMAIDPSRDEVLTGAASHPEIARIFARYRLNGEALVASDTVLAIDEPDFQPERLC